MIERGKQPLYFTLYIFQCFKYFHTSLLSPTEIQGNTQWTVGHCSLVFSCWLLLQFTVNSQLQLSLLQPLFLLQLLQSARIRHLEVTMKWNASLQNVIDYWRFTQIQFSNIGVVLHFDQTTGETARERKQETVMEMQKPTTLTHCKALFTTSVKF